MDIQPQYLSFGKLLSGRLFRIPEYQRAYSWGQKQREDLLEDILSISRTTNGKTHFMATMVGLRRDTRTIITDEHQVVDVVDGQQRITTLIILLRAIINILDEADATEGRIRQELLDTLVKPDEASLLLLQTNHDTSNYFTDFIRTGSFPDPESASMKADRELLLAMQECTNFVSKWTKKGQTPTDLVALLKNRLTLILHEISDEGMVYSVFEVLNSRGLGVSWFDRLKSSLMALVFDSESGNKAEHIDEIHRLWTDIYRCIGLRLGLSTESLRFAATLRLPERPNRPLGEADAVELLVKQSTKSVAAVLKTIRWLKSVTEAVDRLHQDNRMNAVTRIAQARLVATSVLLRDDISAGDQRLILKRWENVSFRIYGLSRKDARTGVGDYVRLAWRITRDKLTTETILAELDRIGAAFPLKKALAGLRNTDCYWSWQGELRYFFCRYEEYLARKEGQDFDNEQWNHIWMARPADSIEHILPKSKGPEKHVHRIGNLVVLPPKLNTKLGVKPPKDKRDAYRKTGLLVAQEVIPHMARWGVTSIEKREKDLLKWALKEWSY